MKKLINYMSELYDLKLDICRIDFMKNDDNLPKLLEFEMVNPGFFLGYMNEGDSDIKNIVTNIIKYCEKNLMHDSETREKIEFVNPGKEG